jgi:Tfp pilus assembly protein PilO
MQIKNRQQILVVAAIAVVALFAGDKIVFTPLLESWKARSEEIGKLRKQVDDGNRLVQRAGSISARWDQMRTNTLPNNTSLAEQQLLKAFDRWSQSSRISVTAITPQWKTDSEDYRTLECRVDASGNISTLSRFLYDIERDPLGLKLESVEITARDKDGAQLALGLQISGLVLTPSEEKP